MVKKYVTLNRFLSIDEINEVLRYNVLNKSPQPHKRTITIQDLKKLKETKDYINRLYNELIKDL